MQKYAWFKIQILAGSHYEYGYNDDDDDDDDDDTNDNDDNDDDKLWYFILIWMQSLIMKLEDAASALIS